MKHPRLRGLAAAAVGAGVSLIIATPALAHAEVEVEPAQAGAIDALVTLIPEAHNHNAGVVSVQVFPPDGIAPSDVTLVDGPDGWEMTADDESYTIAGDELEPDVTPVHTVRVGQLPDAPAIYFRMLVTYGDEQVDRWIEEPSEANPEPANAAPGVELAAAAAPSPAAAPATTPPAEATTPPAGDAAGADEDSGNTGLVIALVVIAAIVAVAVAGLVVLRRRGAAAGSG